MRRSCCGTTHVRRSTSTERIGNGRAVNARGAASSPSRAGSQPGARIARGVASSPCRGSPGREGRDLESLARSAERCGLACSASSCHAGLPPTDRCRTSTLRGYSGAEQAPTHGEPRRTTSYEPLAAGHARSRSSGPCSLSLDRLSTMTEPRIVPMLPSFRAVYEQFREHNGKAFRLLGLAHPSDYDSEECGPMYWIELQCGTRVQAWPEEIFPVLGTDSLP